MTSICYIVDGNYLELFVIVKNYLYVYSNNSINYIKFDYLKDRYSNLVLDECVGDFCSIFVSFINSENQLKFIIIINLTIKQSIIPY